MRHCLWISDLLTRWDQRTSPIPGLGRGLWALVMQPLGLPASSPSPTAAVWRVSHHPNVSRGSRAHSGLWEKAEGLKKDATPLCWDQRLTVGLTVAAGSGEGEGAARRVVPSSFLFLLATSCALTNTVSLNSPRAHPFTEWKQRGAPAAERREGPRTEGTTDRREGPMTGPFPPGPYSELGQCRVRGLSDRQS